MQLLTLAIRQRRKCFIIQHCLHFLLYLFTFTYAMQLTPTVRYRYEQQVFNGNNECFCYFHLVAKDI